MHGDIQACFETDPPESVLNDEGEESDLPPQGSGTSGRRQSDSKRRDGSPGMGGKQRRWSTNLSEIIPTGSHLPDQYSDLVHGHSDNGNLPQRLEALEKSTRRIEVLLGRLCQDLGDNSSQGEETEPQTSALDDDHGHKPTDT